MKFEKVIENIKSEQPTTQRPEETVAETQTEERPLSPEARRVIIEESIRNLREGTQRYYERQKDLTEKLEKLIESL